MHKVLWYESEGVAGYGCGDESFVGELQIDYPGQCRKCGMGLLLQYDVRIDEWDDAAQRWVEAKADTELPDVVRRAARHIALDAIHVAGCTVDEITERILDLVRTTKDIFCWGPAA